MIYSNYTPVKYSLAITLMPHFPNGAVTYGIAKSKGSELLEHKVITEKNWILIGAGEFKSQANPNLENLFSKHHIQNCSTFYFPNFKKTTTQCPLTNRIWKVRYDTLPGEISQSGVDQHESDNLGWANGRMHPTEGQMRILEKYGIKSVSDAIYSDSLWLFLQDINDNSWIKNYSAN